MDKETQKMFEMLMGKLDNIETSQKGMDKRLNGMDKKLNGMDERQKDMEIRQDEIFSVVKAIELSNTTHKAEIDNITYKVAHTEGTINKIGNVINESRAVK